MPTYILPGCIDNILDNLPNGEHTSYMLCADAKKLTSGENKIRGDVDMFGFEDGEKLKERKLRKDIELQHFQIAKASVSNLDHSTNSQLLSQS